MDVTRAKQILQSKEAVQVFHRGSPVWIERVTDENTAEISYLGSERKENVPVYLLVESRPL